VKETNGLPPPGATSRTRVRRLPENAVTDRAALEAILDDGLVAHVAIADEAGQPYVLPVGYARAEDDLLFHGSSASRMFRALAAGAPACVSVTILDGMVLARSGFESSMNYRCAIVLGRCKALEGDVKVAALKRISDHLLPGRWIDIRGPSAKELRATLVLSLSLEECSAKISEGGPEDLEEDLDRPVWAGVVPLLRTWGTPVPAPDLRFDLPPPDYLHGWVAKGG
jgi:nitroimidazol reductase NimA-like FMN-containing flavoprotein (pyridoxamine 5'-phosphate oxidase superfamily)